MALTNPLYNALPKLANIQGFWRFENNFTDLSTNGYTLTQTSGTIDFAAGGKIGKAADLELGDTEYLAIAHASAPNLRVTGDMSMSCHIKPESSTQNAMLMGKYVGSSNSRCYRLMQLTANNIRFSLSNNGVDDLYADSVGTIADAAWGHILVTFERAGGANNMKIYLNNSADGVGTFNNDIRDDADADFSIGAQSDNTQNYDGLIDEVIIWNACLTPAEVAEVFAITTEAMYKKILSNFFPLL